MQKTVKKSLYRNKNILTQLTYTPSIDSIHVNSYIVKNALRKRYMLYHNLGVRIMCCYNVNTGKIGVYSQLDSLRYAARTIVKNLKINGCAICGYNKCVACLEFHHVNSQDRKFGISTKEAISPGFFDEIQKCILLCRNCHTEIHHKERYNDYS